MGGDVSSASRGRKRSEATRKAILRAAYLLLVADGYRALTFEAVAAHAGAGRPTIYRWWPSKAALAIDALLSETHWPEGGTIESSASAARDITVALQRMAKSLSGNYGRALASLIGAARDEPEILAMYKERIAGPRRALAMSCLRHGIETGEFRADIDIDAALDALILPIFVKLMMSTNPIEPDWIDRQARLVLGAIAANPAPAKAIRRSAGKRKSRRAGP